MSDLLKSKANLNFQSLLNKFSDTMRYEAKIELVLSALHLIKRQEAFDLMKIIIEMLDEPASNSFLRNNINPLRVGLLLYRLIDEIKETFGYSMHTASLL